MTNAYKSSNAYRKSGGNNFWEIPLFTAGGAATLGRNGTGVDTNYSGARGFLFRIPDNFTINYFEMYFTAVSGLADFRYCIWDTAGNLLAATPFFIATQGLCLQSFPEAIYPTSILIGFDNQCNLGGLPNSNVYVLASQGSNLNVAGLGAWQMSAINPGAGPLSQELTTTTRRPWLAIGNR